MLALGTRDEATLIAARHVLLDRDKASRGSLVLALSAIAEGDPTPSERVAAATELLELAKEAPLEPRVEIAALRALLGSSSEGAALDRLEALYESAARESVALDGRRAAAWRTLEALLQDDARGPDAARILEPLCEAEYAACAGSAALLLRILALRVDEKAGDPEALEAIWARAGRVLDDGALDASERQSALGRFLPKIARQSPGAVSEWISRVERHVDAPADRSTLFMAALDSGLGGATRLALITATGQALELAGRTEEALSIYEREFAAEPSAALLDRLDALAAAVGRPAAERVARYELAVENAREPETRAELLFALAALQRSALGDPAAALATLNRALREDASHFGAHEALLAVYAELGDERAYERELTRGLAHFHGPERERTLVRLAERLIAAGRAKQALPLCRPLLDDPATGDAALDVLERLCVQTEDAETLRRVLERKVDRAEDAPARARALERLGEFFDEWLHDTERTSQAWKAAAEQYS
ncbi:MAG TPA: hypothetical protein VIL20_09615, partial [Sandaracinaceae bacterium]